MSVSSNESHKYDIDVEGIYLTTNSAKAAKEELLTSVLGDFHGPVALQNLDHLSTSVHDAVSGAKLEEKHNDDLDTLPLEHLCGSVRIIIKQHRNRLGSRVFAPH